MAKLIGESAPDPGDKERFISNDMRQQLEDIGHNPDNLARTTTEQSKSNVPSTRLENMLSVMSPEARENAEAILTDMGSIPVSAEIALGNQLAELEPAFDAVIRDYAESGIAEIENMLENVQEQNPGDHPGPIEADANSTSVEPPAPAKVPRLQPQRLRDMAAEPTGSVAVKDAPRRSPKPARPEPAPVETSVDTRTDFDKQLDAAVDTRLKSKHNQAKELKEHIGWQRVLDKSRIGQELQTERENLSAAKSARWDARLEHNRLTQFMRKAELRGQYERRVAERIEQGEIVGSRRQAQAYREAKRLAKSHARKERVDARSAANTAVENARGNIATLKAEKRDLSFIRRKGSRNSYLNARRMVAGGGFSLGEVSPSGMNEEQKKKLEARKAKMLSSKQAAKHAPRGRPSTRAAAVKTKPSLS